MIFLKLFSDAYIFLLNFILFLNTFIVENVNWQNFSLEDFVTREEKVLHLPGISTYVLNRPTTTRITSSVMNNNSGSQHSDASKEVKYLFTYKHYIDKFVIQT